MEVIFSFYFCLFWILIFSFSFSFVSYHGMQANMIFKYIWVCVTPFVVKTLISVILGHFRDIGKKLFTLLENQLCFSDFQPLNLNMRDSFPLFSFFSFFFG